MAARMRDTLMRALDGLRYEPTEKRVRATIDGETVADSSRAVLMWEPRRVVASYAVPVEDLRGELVPAPPRDAEAPGPLILHPGIPFSVHSSEGDALSLHVAGATREAAAFRPADPDLAGYVVLDWHGFDKWFEEDERLVAHPRDPYHRIDIRRSSRHVRVELDGEVLAESSRATLLFETNLPLRSYLPRADVRAELRPSPRRTYCAYKGEASYWSVDAGGRRVDLAWTYADPLPEAREISGLVAFFDERVDVVLDGERRERPRTAIADAILDEAGVGG